MLDKNKPISYFNDVNRRTQTISELEGFSSRYYTGIGSEIREDAINNATKVVVNLPQGLGRYDIASASESSANDNAANSVPSFEWYLKNHLGSTMLVYGTQGISDPTVANLGSLKAAYDYRAFGEQVDLTHTTDKVTETFTGKELDDETELSNHGARMLDPMLGIWIAVDPERFFSSPYLYMGNGYNPIRFVDLKGEKPGDKFDTPDEAAKDWVQYTNPSSKMLNMEFCGYLYKSKDNKYVAANPSLAHTDAFTLDDLKKTDNSSLGTKTGILHTHGETNFFGYDDNYMNEDFSTEDILFSQQENLEIYLGTPSNETLKYSPQTGDTEYITDNNLVERK
jgi:RHS repeat-associated protein